MGSIRFRLDGREIEAHQGENIWRAAERHGVEIPHLCYAPHPGFRADGNCRACMVFIPFCYAEEPANLLTNQALDPFGKIPEFKFCAAKVEAL